YAGNLSIPYIDWCLILEVVRDYENVQFLFVGPNTTSASDAKMIEAKAKVFQSPNVTLAGSMALEQLHQCYQSADVLFLAYQEKYQDTQVANTHKLMEYLGTG